MQNLAIGAVSRVLNKRARSLTIGFTLLELLIVLVIMGVVIAAVTLSIENSHHGQRARSATNILRARMVFAEQQAIVQATTIGLAISQQGYQFYRLTDQLKSITSTWEAIKQEQVLKFHSWEGDFDISLSLPQQPNALVPNNLPDQPMIVFTPSGSVTPFTLRLNGFMIIAKRNGEITVGTNDAG